MSEVVKPLVTCNLGIPAKVGNQGSNHEAVNVTYCHDSASHGKFSFTNFHSLAIDQRTVAAKVV